MPLKYKVGKNTPGHFKRVRAYYEYQEKLANEKDPLERYELLLDWLAAYLSWPPTRFLKRVAIRLASQEEVDGLIKAVTGLSAEVEPKKDDSSDGG